MISAKHQFLDLTIPNSERKHTTSLFGKIPEAATRSVLRDEADVRTHMPASLRLRCPIYLS